MIMNMKLPVDSLKSDMPINVYDLGHCLAEAMDTSLYLYIYDSLRPPGIWRPNNFLHDLVSRELGGFDD
jgi:hypothetical protein